MRRLLIVGAGGHGRNVAEAALLSGKWEEISLLDDSYPNRNTSGPFSIIGGTDQLQSLAVDFDGIICAIGNNKIRRNFLVKFQELKLPVLNIIHPRAFVSPTASLGVGCVVMAGAVVGPGARIGVGCILNANATADHDAVMKDYSHLGVGVAISGTTVLEEGAWLQAGRSVGYDVVVPAWANWK